MEERITDVENTGALPTGAPSEEPARRERPSWVEDARAGLNEPGKYLAYEESGRHVVLALSRCRRLRGRLFSSWQKKHALKFVRSFGQPARKPRRLR